MSYDGVSFYTKEPVYECELTEKDLEGKYMDNNDCPFHRSMKRAGVDVDSVGGVSFTTNDGHDYSFTARMKELNSKLSDRYTSNLIGESFTVRI